MHVPIRGKKMPKKLRIVLAQLNLLVGDIAGNLQKHIQAAVTARDEMSADIIVFPELGLTGYPPEDLLLRKGFIDDANVALQQFIAEVKGIYSVISHPYRTPQGLFNACSLINNGSIAGRYAKHHLPNYGVFDECRYFIPCNEPCVVPINGIPTGLVICEDLWQPGPTQQAAAQGARIILSPNASPFEVDKQVKRMAVLSKRANDNHVAIVYVNNVGGQDELVFDGGSMVINEAGKLCQFAGFFNETLMPVDMDITPAQIHIESTPIILPSDEEKIYQALVLGVRDYSEKNHFPGVIVGVSGGIDSALTLTIAVDALGKDRVHAVMMPSRYTAEISNEDAINLVRNLGVKSETISIEPIYKRFLESLAASLAEKKPDITEENIQARCRAVILMALSNKYGNLVLTTGNRSEIAVGYCTLYGDMAGGFAVLKDVPKTLVYQLATYRNQRHPVIPKRTIDRPPTAELAPDQKDEDSLPPYSVLDKILECYLNQSQSIDEIVAVGFERAIVTKVVNLIHKNEYKRRQAAIGPRINHSSFGKDWRYPMTNGYKR
jgi:NAD+ synthase (glutamine-hydrolysing)